MAIQETAHGRGGEISPPKRDEAFIPIAARHGRRRRTRLPTGALLGAFALGSIGAYNFDCFFDRHSRDLHKIANPFLRDFSVGVPKSLSDLESSLTVANAPAFADDGEIEIKFKGIVPAVLPNEVGAAVQVTNNGPALKAVFVRCLAFTDGGDPIGFGIKEAAEIPRNAVVFDQVRIDTGGRKQDRIECYPATRW